VWHLDEKAVLGSFYRINEKAQELANKLNKKMYYYVKTSGGSQRAWKDPE
jgi:hypothetical protein